MTRVIKSLTNQLEDQRIDGEETEDEQETNNCRFPLLDDYEVERTVSFPEKTEVGNSFPMSLNFKEKITRNRLEFLN